MTVPARLRRTVAVRLLVLGVAGWVAGVGIDVVDAGQVTATPSGTELVSVTGTSASAVGIEPFELIGASAPAGPVIAEVRVHRAGTWGPWEVLETSDLGSEEGAGAAAATGWTSEPLWVESADGFELRVPAPVEGLEVVLVRSGPGQASAAASPATGTYTPGAPGIFDRASWGARPPKTTPTLQADIRMVFVHHTVNANDYSAAAVPGILRSIQNYHMDSPDRLYNDIAYNWLIDRFGRIWEGRGGLYFDVLGAATGGFNSQSVSVAVLGDFSGIDPSPAVISAIAAISGFELGRSNVDPLATTQVNAAGHANSRYGAGQIATFPTIAAHTDASYTGCPGRIANHLDRVRAEAVGWAQRAGAPFGSVDTLRRAPGGVVASGWAIDPNTAAPIVGHGYVDVSGSAIFTADQRRDDVGAALPAFGPNHGYAAFVPTPSGRHAICTYGINAGYGDNSLVGCQVTTIENDPIGSLDVVSGSLLGLRTVRGWAIDPDVAGAISVHLYVDQTPVAAVGADRSRPDVGAAYPHYGAHHGFEASIFVPAGRRAVCAYGINAAAGTNALLGCTIVG